MPTRSNRTNGKQNASRSNDKISASPRAWIAYCHACVVKIFVCSILALAACLIAPQSRAQTGEIDVRGPQLTRDGRPWIPKGVTIVGRVSPASVAAGGFKLARDAFGPGELNEVRSVFHADTVRFQISQPGLNSKSSIYSPEYKTDILNAWRTARSAGFAVILSMQWEPPSGLKGERGMPSEPTVQAWRSICKEVGADRGTMLELFNEPNEKPAEPSAAAEWHSGMQAAVTAVRSCGAQNVLILDGLNWARFTADLALPNDPLHRLAFGIHPYLFNGFTNPAVWERQFGRRAEQVATLVTEWNGTATAGCVPDLPRMAAELLQYLRQKRIGVVGWAMDFPGTLFADRELKVLTSYRNFQECKQTQPIGAGELFRDWVP